MKDLFLILGNKIKVLLILSLPLGILVGIVEIIFALALNDLLITANLIEGEIRIGLFNPLYFIFIIGFLRFCFVFLTQLNTNYIFELVNKQIRDVTIDNNYNYNKEIGILKSQKILNVISTKVAEFLHSCANISIQSFIFLIIYINLILQSAILTSLSSLFFLILVLPLILIKKKISIYSNNFQKKLSSVNEKIFKDIRNINFLRIIGSLIDEKKNIKFKNQETLNPYKKYLFSLSFINQIPQFIGIVIIALIIISNQKFNFIGGSVIVPFLYLMLRCIVSFGNISNDYGRILFTKPFADNLIHIIKENRRTYDFENKNDGLIEVKKFNLNVKGLSIGYDTVIRSNINFSVKEGSFNLISGSSGIGKTLLLMSLIGIIKKKDGEILWNGHQIEKINLSNLRKEISYCGTDPFLIEGTILDNLLYGLNKHPNNEQINSVLELSRCDFLKKDNNFDLNLYLDNEGSGLSSGQRQRISIARALIGNPKILILDEATVNIDEDNEFEILKNLKEKYFKCTIFAISHRESLKNFADQIIEIK